MFEKGKLLHIELKVYKVCINNVSWLTLTNITGVRDGFRSP